MTDLPQEITNDLGQLLSQLVALGFVPRASRYDADSFGNYYVVLSRANAFVRIVRDRSQYILDGDKKDLEPVGLWRAFDNREEFTKQVLTWAKSTGA